MTCSLRGFIAYLLKLVGLYHYFSLWVHGPLHDDGWFRSVREGASIDANGDSIPWFTYPTIEFLSRRIHSEMSVFEYGCGESTLWWANRVKRVVSCEHDESWYRTISLKKVHNIEIKCIPLEYGGAYCREVANYTSAFDIIIIDGRDRVNCVRNALNALKPSGIIIWDNSDRDEYRVGYHFLFENNFKKIEFTGMTPIVNYKSETGVFYRKGNCLGI